jgi:hypothetical protein
MPLVFSLSLFLPRRERHRRRTRAVRELLKRATSSRAGGTAAAAAQLVERMRRICSTARAGNQSHGTGIQFARATTVRPAASHIIPARSCVSGILSRARSSAVAS